MNAITPGRYDKLPLSFYRKKNVCSVAKALLGKVLITTFEGKFTAGRIVETEAYNGIVDKASHAWNGRRTDRTEIMYAPGGVSYVYLCYGIHHLFNVVTNVTDIPHAVLIRALEPLAGIEHMLERTRKTRPQDGVTRGPGNLTKALGIRTQHSGLSLLDDELCIADDAFTLKPSQVLATPRIGVEYAGEDAALPYRFIVKGSNWISGKRS
jgi:DNA-3-methyladenine glycosylase